MHKAFFKKCLSILDMIEIHVVFYNELESLLKKELQDDFAESIHLLPQVCSYLRKYEFLKDTGNGIDLSACAAVFAKSDSLSQLEALAFFECLYRYDEYRRPLQECANHKCTDTWLSKQLDPISFSLLTKTSLFISEHNYYIIDEKYRNNIFTIIGEYQVDKSSLISTCLCAYYTKKVLASHTEKLTYKNERLQPVAYSQLPLILKHLPNFGVPCEREAVKGLQVFYKDTLFHECSHECILCHINLPHMLIASHIKPFRDCAHIYEAVDYHNGLLLCRNHDFLFDQGYISFDNNGELLISEIMQKLIIQNHDAYQLNTSCRLSETLLNTERKLFLAYHRKHIFLDHNGNK